METETEAKVNRIKMTGNKVAQAILFHLDDEGWIKRPHPQPLINWIQAAVKGIKPVYFKREDWIDIKSGTQRMLWLMITIHLDPYELCKWVKTPDEAKAMHLRFTNIIQSWSYQIPS